MEFLIKGLLKDKTSKLKLLKKGSMNEKEINVISKIKILFKLLMITSLTRYINPLQLL